MAGAGEPRRIPVIVAGVGGVGSALVRQLVAGRDRAAERAGCRFDLVALVDRRGRRISEDGLPDLDLLAALAAKGRGEPVGPPEEAGREIGAGRALAALDRVAGHWPGGGIVVDTTAAEGMEPLLDRALDLGWGVALANKRPLAGPWATARRYFASPRVRHESTVGGGQPVIATLRYLVDTGDPIVRIEGQLSGSLGFLCRELERGVAFSAAVREAARRGYTEPDPRDDLGGRDVRRKLLILARMAGWPLEEADVEIEALYPPALDALGVPEFLDALAEIDDAIGIRLAAAKAEGKVLRHVAGLEGGRGTVGLVALPGGSPLANLKYVSFRTGRYDDEPLLVGGKGAGVEMTAAGVVGDLFGLAREVFS